MTVHDNGANLPLWGVRVFVAPYHEEIYFVGEGGVTAVQWHEQSGHMAMIPTIRVYIDGELHFEHPFHSVLGVYYVPTEDAEDEDAAFILNDQFGFGA